jgi:hypothetical protein
MKAGGVLCAATGSHALRLALIAAGQCAYEDRHTGRGIIFGARRKL